MVLLSALSTFGGARWAQAQDGMFPSGFELPDYLQFDTDLDEPRADDPYRVRGLALPAVAYAPETSVSFTVAGFMQWRFRDSAPDSIPSRASLLGTYTLNRQWLTQFNLDVQNRDELNRVSLKIGVGSWRASYFGIGDRSRLRDEELYRRQFFEAELALDRAVIARRLYIGLVAGIDRATIEPLRGAGLLTLEPPLGLGRSIRAGLGPSISWDTRDRRLFPYRGAYLRGELVGYGPHLGSTYTSLQGSLDARAFVSRRAHVGAFRALMELNTPDTPFFALAALGGASTMRGMAERRYIDNNRWVLQSEYRTPFLWRFGAVAFASLGDVFAGFDTPVFDNPKWSAGGGVRFALIPENGLNLRLDYGATRGDTGFYVSVGEAF